MPDEDEIANCSRGLAAEVALLKPAPVLPVGKLAIAQFISPAPLNEIIGRTIPIRYRGHAMECIPLPHPSGASPWHRMEPGQTRLRQALALVAAHSATQR